MAIRKPLVIISGQVQQLPAGDTLDASVSEVDVIAATNSNIAAITRGQPVYVDGAGSVDLAAANASGTRQVLGLVLDASIASAASGNIQTDGVINLADWTSVVGAASLTAGSIYYLSATAGQLTSTAPTTAGQYVCRVGLALSTTEMEIDTDRNGVLLA